MLPVTVESITDTHGGSNSRWRWAPVYATMSGLIGLACLLLAIGVQIFWVAGASLTEDAVGNLLLYDELTEKIIAKEHAMEVGQVADAAVDQLYARMGSLFAQIVADGESLHQWNLFWERFIPFVQPPFGTDFYNRLEGTTKVRVDVASSELVLQGLASYILPLLFGLLGAAVYIIRKIAADVARSIFTRGSFIQYMLRLALGPLAGVAVGLLLVPDVSSGEAAQESQVTLLRTLSPLGLAFVAGYGVELVFAVMDRIISAFTSRDVADSVSGGSRWS